MMLMPLLMLSVACLSYPGYAYRITSADKRYRSFALQSQQLPSDSLDSSNGTGDRKLFFSQKSFAAVGLSDMMVGVVSSMQILTPSKIQAIAFYGVNTMQHCIIADQTGSGKTLAYLLPTIQRMILLRKDGQLDRSSPFIIVMTPTSELAT